ncbi:hypothetical protein PHYSODRAFT_485981 [Phytophthora sojae]|uniref:Uncharacterized protein n=1 Tax=Phytophthora sojae (strain P6497) TaxID=1094619 RepID=G4YXW8_PHYSP|nr:hypothetical protein PHYSODRAFT_485981 [Phytophthora sojae]EGZ25671.1 hypothetical protein PHYSODRAFT_485981 [Phytophthora sojae]|eukprot:XP_009520959.1 hypothetical protein PHYSODRAFT_485981 [Phytophthora sojae]
MQTLRTRVLTKMLDTPTPFKWLPPFLDQWESYCRELVGLASGWKVVGDIGRARSTLGKCFDVVRRHLKAPFARPSRNENDESQALRHVAAAAKQLLLECPHLTCWPPLPMNSGACYVKCLSPPK